MWILIFIVSTATSSQSGAAGIAPEFTSQAKCMTAATLVSSAALRNKEHILVAACVEK